MLTIDADRFRDSFERYSEIGATENGGLHRLALSDEDRAVRDRFVADCESLGLDVRVDRVGNIFARRAGTDPDAAPVLIGSHLDSQPKGGRFDGQLGVLTALETLRTFADEGVETRRPIELVNWTNEEGSRFTHAMMGSGAWVGELSVDHVLEMTDSDGLRVADELDRIGYAGDEPVEPFDVHAGLELHIEQGPQLAERGLPLGVVEGVFGMGWLRVTVHGETDHAGPTPMHTRQDALATAADAISELNRLPNRLSEDAVATVGELHVEPNSINVIPDRVEFTVDLRSYDDAVIDEGIAAVEAELTAACERHGTSFDLTTEMRSSPAAFAPEVRDAVAGAADALDIPYDRILSPAGHDAKYVNDYFPAGMVFVPSEGGKTHNEAEFTEWDDCVQAATVFANATRSLADD